MSHDFNDETERVRHHYEETASKYDKKVGFTEKVQFADGRSWVYSQARGEALEGCKGASTVRKGFKKTSSSPVNTVTQSVVSGLGVL